MHGGRGMFAYTRSVLLKAARFGSLLFQRPGVRGLVVMAVFAAGVAFPPPALANTITVTTTTDSLITDGSCSIREAIINANNDAATWPDCAALRSAGRVLCERRPGCRR